MTVGLAKSLWRVDSSLVGVEDYLGRLLFSFVHKLFEYSQTMIIWFVAALDGSYTVRKDLIVERIQQDCPYEIKRLKMENKLLRDFLQLTGRKWGLK